MHQSKTNLSDRYVEERAFATAERWVARRFSEVEIPQSSVVQCIALHPAVWWSTYVLLGSILLFWLDSRLKLQGVLLRDEFLAIPVPLSKAEALGFVVLMLLSSLGVPIAAGALASFLNRAGALKFVGEILLLLGRRGERVLEYLARGVDSFEKFRRRWGLVFFCVFLLPGATCLPSALVLGNASAAVYVDGVRVRSPLGVVERRWSELSSVYVECVDAPSYILTFHGGRVVELVNESMVRWDTLFTIDTVMRHREMPRTVGRTTNECREDVPSEIWASIVARD